MLFFTCSKIKSEINLKLKVKMKVFNGDGPYIDSTTILCDCKQYL